MLPIINRLNSRKFRRFICKEVDFISNDDDIFLLIETNLKAIVHTLEYAEYWARIRQPPILIAASHAAETIDLLFPYICPSVKVLRYDNPFPKWLFRRTSLQVYHNFFSKNIFSYFKTIASDSLYLFEYQPIPYDKTFTSPYNHFIESSETKDLPKPFLKAYTQYNQFCFKRKDTWNDYFQIFSEITINDRKEKLEKINHLLLHTLGINRPYVILHLNSSPFRGTSSKKFSLAIDLLIRRGYAVILQGQREQPAFAPRQHFHDYSRDVNVSLENDLALYAYAEFVISSKGNSEILAQVFNTPLLGLNYVEPTSLLPHKKHRFFFKHVYDKREEKYLSWREYLNHPGFFNHTNLNTSSELRYDEMSEEEIIHTIEEFLTLLDKNEESWLDYSPLQQTFKGSLEKKHFDLHKAYGVPTMTYLEQMDQSKHSTSSGPLEIASCR